MGRFTYELDLPPGLNSDETTFSAKGRWVDGNNVRFSAGKPEVVGVFTKLNATQLTGVIWGIYPFSRSDSVSIAYGTASKLYVGVGAAAPDDRTPSGLGTGWDSWSFASWGETLLAAPEGGKLYEQSGTGAATEVTQAPDQITFMLVTPERQVLAFGCNEEVSGTFNGRCIRGSDIEDYTDWTTSSTNNAFEHILDGGSQIIGARMVGPYVAVWTDTSLYMGQFLGDPSQTYRFDLVANGCGLVGPNAITVMNGVAYWFGGDFQLRAWAPGSLPTIITCPIRGHMVETILPSLVQARRIHTCGINRFNEVWIHYPTPIGGYRYIAVCLNDGSWFRGNIARTAMVDDAILNAFLADNHRTTVLAASVDRYIHVHECERTQASPEGPSWYIQSGDFYIDSSNRRVMVQRMLPNVTYQNNTINLTLFCRDRPDSSAVAKGPYAIADGATKVDFRASGKVISFKLSDDQTNQIVPPVRLGKPVFDVVPLGER